MEACIRRTLAPAALLVVTALMALPGGADAASAKASFSLPELSIGPIKGPGPKGCVRGRTKIHVRLTNVFSPTRTKTSVGTRVLLDGAYIQPRAPYRWIWAKWSGRPGQTLKFDIFVDAGKWRPGTHRLMLGAVDIAEIDLEYFASLDVVRCRN